jgi:hypothetical protein
MFQANDSFVLANNNFSISNLTSEVNDAISTSSVGSSGDDVKKKFSLLILFKTLK